MQDRVNVIISDGGSPQGPVETMMAAGRHGALLDTINKFKEIDYFGDIFLITNFPSLAADAKAMGVKVRLNHLSPEDFHYGQSLKKLITEENLQRVFCMGGGSIPLIERDELSKVGKVIALEKERVVFSNNVQSGDFTAFTRAGEIKNIPLPRQDNALATLLRDEGGFAMKLFPNSPGLIFDLDTPVDLLVLGSCGGIGPRAAECLKRLNLEFSGINAAKEVLMGDYREVFLVGRVGAPVIARINENLKVRLRIFSEERGMKALGRLEKKEVVSLAGYMLEDLGPKQFVRHLSRVAHCVIWDTRVLFAHMGLDLPDEERFSADLGLWENLSNPLLQELVREIKSAPIPILCGGHSLVSGSLWVMTDDIGPQHPFNFSVIS